MILIRIFLFVLSNCFIYNLIVIILAVTNHMRANEILLQHVSSQFIITKLVNEFRNDILTDRHVSVISMLLMDNLFKDSSNSHLQKILTNIRLKLIKSFRIFSSVKVMTKDINLGFIRSFSLIKRSISGLSHSRFLPRFKIATNNASITSQFQCNILLS